MDSCNVGANSNSYDLVFIDSEKKVYKDCLSILLDSNLLSDGAIIITDNVLLKGSVLFHVSRIM
jgi:predicted O-methyltransferase YrrM